MASHPGLTTVRDTTTGLLVQSKSFEELMDYLQNKQNPNLQEGAEVGYSNQTGSDNMGLYAESSSIDFLNSFVDKIVEEGNTGSHDSFLNPKSVSARVVFITLYSLISVMSLLGNSLVCLVVVRNKRMRSVTNFFLTNQALSDMLMTVLNIPFIAYSQLAVNWPFGSIMCHLADYIGMTSVYVSTFMLTAIALDRHRVIIHPLRPRITMATAVAIDILIWVLALTLSVPFAIYRETQQRPSNPDHLVCIANYPGEPGYFRTYFVLATFICQYVIPLSLTSGAYVRIGMKLWAQAAVGDMIAQQQAANNRAKQRTIRMLVLVVAVFAICWCPINMYLIVSEFIPTRKSAILYLWLHWFAMCSVCINPVAFAFLNENFRSELKATFHCWFLKVNFKRNSKYFGRTTDGNENSHTTERHTTAMSGYESVTTRTTNGKSPGSCETYQMEVKLTTGIDDTDGVREYEV
ncbi:G-protein coupled receptor 83-like [Asterias amurensis]|uniref:G-protein coupled receptor 83-like n=1 Tax=Asterias amurensis TaxID=7602 RepID=UPI003AB855B9